MEEKKKRIETQRAKPKPRISIPAIDALVGDEEQTGGEKEAKTKKETGIGSPT